MKVHGITPECLVKKFKVELDAKKTKTIKIKGHKKTSLKLWNIPVDKLVVDERDEMISVLNPLFYRR
jgi:hypothetical protein